mmetsp:Transcript_13924/g.44159  ORF Transcript_13924/g.44159 Transcript_13924/m.44159 type:complete len:112 (-) Transcript_13924:1251-1586(-)
MATIRAPVLKAAAVSKVSSSSRSRFAGAPVAAPRRASFRNSSQNFIRAEASEVGSMLKGAVNIDIGRESGDVYGSVQNYYGEVGASSPASCALPCRQQLGLSSWLSVRRSI